MAILSRPAIKTLLESAPPAPLVSIYLPTHSAPTPPNLTEDRRRFKNIRNKVLEILKASPEVDVKSTQAIERQLSSLEDDLHFWETRTLSVAIFISLDDTVTIDLPIDSDEYVAVDSHFHVTPLLGLVNECMEYSVLVLSKKHPMLFSGNMYGLKSTDVQLPEAQSSRGHEQENQANTTHLPPKGKGRQDYFGNNFPLVTREDIIHYFKAIDQVVQKNLPKSCVLVLAGPEPDVSTYRSISTIPTISKGHIESANSATTPHDLSPFAWALVQEENIRLQRQDELDRFSRLSNGPERASSELAAIQNAADTGRIDTLIIKLIRTTADTVRDNKQAAPKIHFPTDEQMAVIEAVALQTWRNQGKISLIEDTSTVPPNSAIGAIFRY